MYDTINLKLSNAKVEHTDFLAEVPLYLEQDSITHHEHSSGQRYITGKLGNLSVSINNYRVAIKDGSICKWKLGDNYQTMGRRDMQEAIEALSDTLHLPMNKADVTRIDVGYTMIVKEPTEIYTYHLGELKNARRSMFGNGTLYYYRRNGAEAICFYDKNREWRAKGETIPELYRNRNVLRYEQRYLKNLPNLLKTAEVTGESLYNENFYMYLLKRWGDTYKAIEKINDREISPRITTKKDFYRMAVFEFVKNAGGKENVLSMIKRQQRRGNITKEQAYGFRQLINDATGLHEGLITENEAIKELDRTIRTALRYYR